MTDDHETRALLRLLTGELSPDDRRRLEDRLAAEPELRAAAERLQSAWEAVDLPAAAAPPGFADGVMARISGAEPETPAWARLAAAAALLAGVAVGVGFGRAPAERPGAEALPDAPPTLAESYFEALAELDSGVGE